MVKLSEKEVENLIDKEEGRGGYLGEDLPRDAHSVFRFDIKETSKDLLKEIKTLPKKHFPDVQKIDEDGGVHFYKGDSKASWEYYEDDKGHMFLSDPDFYSRAEVKITNDGLDIVTAWSGYTYNIKDKGDGLGAEVEFHGPLNALLKQNLLPSMTYVPHTLEGKFTDAKTQKDLTPFMDIRSYEILRAAKNEKCNEFGEKGNMQDYYGAWVNKKFNNEIISLPQSYSGQERKNHRAQKQFERGEKTFIFKCQKEEINKRIEAIRGKVSGVVKADEKAEKKNLQNKMIQVDRSRS